MATVYEVAGGAEPGKLEGMSATVEIVRDTPDDIQDRWVRIRVDDGPEEILRYGQTLRLQVAPGPHRLRAHNTLGRDALAFDVQAGQTLRVRCYNQFSKSGPLLMLAIGFAFIKVKLEVVAQG